MNENEYKVENSFDAENTEIGTDSSEEELMVEEIPSVLSDLRIKRYIVGGLMVILSIGFSIMCREWKMLFLALFGGWFIYNGYIIRNKYLNGQIEEKLLVCTSVRKSMVQDTVTVCFRTNDEHPSFYQFKVVGKKKSDEFMPEASYVVYYESSNPSQMMAYIPV